MREKRRRSSSVGVFERERGREKETDSADEAVDSTQSGSLCLLISFKFDKIMWLMIYHSLLLMMIFVAIVNYFFLSFNDSFAFRFVLVISNSFR